MTESTQPIFPAVVLDIFTNVQTYVKQFLDNNQELYAAGATVEDSTVLVMCQCKAFVMQQSMGAKALPQLLYIGCQPIKTLLDVKREINDMYRLAKTEDEKDNVARVIQQFAAVFVHNGMRDTMLAWGMILPS